jgi:hypothetical protein
MIEVLSSSETLVLTRATRRYIPEDGILHSHRRENLKLFLRSVRRLLVAANVVPSSPILVTLIMEELCSSETSVLTRATRHNIPEDGILCLIGVYTVSCHVTPPWTIFISDYDRWENSFLKKQLSAF